MTVIQFFPQKATVMAETHVQNPKQVFIFAITSTVLFAFMNLAVKYAAESGIHVTQIILFRNLLALPVVLYLITKSVDSKTMLLTSRPFSHAARGLVGIAAMACFFLSFKMLPLGDATALHFASPLILTALSVPFLKEQVGIWRWSAVGVGLIGVIIVAAPTGEGNMVGSAIALLAAALAAVAAILVRRMGDTEHSLTIVFYFTVSGIVVALVTCPFFWQPINSVWVFYALIMVGILGGVAQYFLTKAYAEAPAAYVSVFSYAAIIFSIGFDIIFWGIFPNLNIWIGSAVIVASGLVILYREVVHKGRQARLSLYGLTPIRPTQADLEDEKHPPRRRKSDRVNETINMNEEKEL
jgi:drug/metabolite transporter (DMT)-like permease